MYFYFVLKSWSKTALDFVAGGSFILAPPDDVDLVIKNLFGTSMKKAKEVEEMNALLKFFKSIIKNYAKRLSDKRNLHHLELLSKDLFIQFEGYLIYHAKARFI